MKILKNGWNKMFLFGLSALVLTFGLIVIGCDNDPEPDPTYTVWTDTTFYSEYSNKLGTLNNGYYIHVEVNNSQWNELVTSLTNEGKHSWTEKEIYNWFIGRGFGNTEADQEKAWLLTIDHGFIASRSGSIVYMLLK
ncbi:hypothetical protein FACS1894190_12090 [Spirochaetia bacterium]|nr:hypothetical protein FACS1894190_12090 [Spirochaetia bacterium]